MDGVVSLEFSSRHHPLPSQVNSSGARMQPRRDSPVECEGEPDRWVHSACLLCSNGCGLDIAVKDGRIVGVRGASSIRSTSAISGRRASTPGSQQLPASRHDADDPPPQSRWLQPVTGTKRSTSSSRSSATPGPKAMRTSPATTPASSRSRSSTRSGRFGAAGCSPRTSTATRGCARRPRRQG